MQLILVQARSPPVKQTAHLRATFLSVQTKEKKEEAEGETCWLEFMELRHTFQGLRMFTFVVVVGV